MEVEGATGDDWLRKQLFYDTVRETIVSDQVGQSVVMSLVSDMPSGVLGAVPRFPLARDSVPKTLFTRRLLH